MTISSPYRSGTGTHLATYPQFCGLAASLGGIRSGEHVWRFDLPGDGKGREQTIFVLHEIMAPDFEFLLLKSAFAAKGAVNCAKVLENFGQLHAGAIGFSPSSRVNGGGYLTISSSIPLAALDLAEPAPFILYLHILARAADSVQRRLALQVAADLR